MVAKIGVQHAWKGPSWTNVLPVSILTGYGTARLSSCKAVLSTVQGLCSRLLASCAKCAEPVRFTTTMRFSPGRLLKAGRCPMFTWTKNTVLGAALALSAGVIAASAVAQDLGLGRAATPAEVQAWDIDVRADFKGLPKGSGTVDQGEELWESTCAVCHGSFAESNLYFTPLIGGTTAEDIETGRVASLISPTQSVRTTIMKATSVSTLWDYINRAMPWDNPKSLTHDEVYASLAYLLSLAEIVDYDFTLSDENIHEVQARMPNRDGAVFWEGLWKVDGKPDTSNTACMSDCIDEVVISSELPAYARDANGDYAAQMRIVGPVRGVNALEPALTGTVDDNAEAVRQ